MAESKIEWTDLTWNPTTGCTPISPGCANCYAKPFSLRLKAMGLTKYQDGFKVRCHQDALHIPAEWKKPRRIFINSMSDLFHPQIPDSFIESVFKVIEQNPQHDFQLLTKRAERMVPISKKFSWPINLWAGVTVESSKYLFRLDYLRLVPAAVRFVSFEPLLESITPDLTEIHWVISGGETGPNARYCDPRWIEDIYISSLKKNIPFFFKSWGMFTSPLSDYQKEVISQSHGFPAAPLRYPTITE